MVGRAEQIFYGLVGILFLTVYQALVQPWLFTQLGEGTGLGEMLLFNGLVWAGSVMFVYVLIRMIKNRARDGEEV